MYALPPHLAPPSEDRISGIACPVCHGSLTVRAEGAGHLHFTCRVGHAFSLKEVVAALEQLFEDTLWAAIRTAEEVDALLTDVLEFRGRVSEAPPEATYERRRRHAREQAASLRRVLEGNEPIAFTGPEAEVTAGEGP